jgi:hypothetical protein
MSSKRPFLPTDKPKFWITFVLAGLTGLAAGLVAFVSSLAGLELVSNVFKVVFVICWAIGAFSCIGLFAGTLTGKYQNLTDQRWKDQLW